MAFVKSEPRDKALTSAALATVTRLATDSWRLRVEATGSYESGIGRVGFVLVDLTKDPLSNVVDRKDAGFATPPREVTDAWTPAAPLARGVPYRVFFHVYDRTGVNLVAYERRDFTCCDRARSKEEGEP